MNPCRAALFAVFGLILLAFSTACSGPDECERFKRFAEDDSKRAETLAWVERNFFAQPVPGDALVSSMRSLPASRLDVMLMRPEMVPADIPDELRGAVIEVVGRKVAELDFIVIRTERFKRIAVAREDLRRNWEYMRLKQDALTFFGPQVASVCIRPFE